jgi:hypothetical protein
LARNPHFCMVTLRPICSIHCWSGWGYPVSIGKVQRSVINLRMPLIAQIHYLICIIVMTRLRIPF